MQRELIPGDIYKHFKNKLYQIIGVATHSETKEKYVVYQALYDDFGMYIRPYDMFMSEVDHVKYPDVLQKYRFEKVEKTQLKPEIKQAPTKEVMQTVEEPEDVEECSGQVNPYLMEFFDKDTSKEKIEYLCSVRSKVDDKMINDIAVSLDLTVEEADIDTRFDSLIGCLKMKARFETGRLR